MPNVLSIFSGGGGIDCGFKKAGFDICFSTDFWKPACDTLEKNKVGKLVVCDDIRKIDYDKYLADIGMKKSDIDVLVGGPPCPAYSKSRFYRTDKKRALEDENSFTLYEYFRALDEIRPKVFFFENVFGFVYKPHQAAFDLLKERADEYGYAEQVEAELKMAINNLFDGADVSPVNDEFKEVYKIVIPRDEERQTFFVCLKGTTPGGRSNLQNEQRIQQKAKYLNYANDRKNEGNKVSCLGVYKHESETVFCAWNINPSTASPETPISKQIKITTIARALTEGFVQQMSGSGEYVCAFKKEFIYFYLVNSSWIHNAPISHLNEHNSEMIEEENETDEEKTTPEVGANILFYGVPGAGKSYEIDKMIVQERSERVVFHPDYTYSDFVGQILPRIIKKEGESEGKLRYVFEPGPFTKMLKKAHDDPSNMYFLVIEEINRGNAPAIFGDIFQLLDRNDDGSGKYHISNYDMAKVVFGDSHEDEAIRIPANLTLLATMNTSDQNVFTLDTAFQRRWEMHLIKNDVYKAEHAGEKIEGSEISWGRFADVTNREIIRFGEETGSSEDKRLGAYFARINELTKKKFPEKVLKYLWDDAFKMDHYTYFNENISSVDGIIDVFRESQSEVDILRRVLKLAVYQKMIGQAVAPENNEEIAESLEAEEGKDDE